VFSIDPADDDESWFIFRSSRDLQQVRIVPQLLSGDEVDPVLCEVSVAFPEIELKRHNGI
jgi:hypothetical protein